jgi:hypothetical protein
LKGSTDNLTPKQEKAIVALLSNPTYKEAAKACGVSDVTLWRWLKEPHFQSEYRAARRQAVEMAIANLQLKCSDMGKVLIDIAEDTEMSGAARVAAAKAVLEQSLDAVTTTDMMERLDKIEAALSERPAGS